MMMMVTKAACARHTATSMRRSRIVSSHVDFVGVGFADQLGPVATAFAVRLGSKNLGGLVEAALDTEPDMGEIWVAGLANLPESVVGQFNDEGGEVHVMLLAASADRSRVFT